MSATRPCRVVVLISGSGSNLQAILDRFHNDPCVEVCAVISNQADAYGLQRAVTAGIAKHVLEHNQYADREDFDRALIAQIDSYQPDLLVLAGFMRVLTSVFTQHYHGRLMNIHPSLLPKHKGLNTHQRVLDAGDNEHGCSVHFVTEHLDGGPLIIQARTQVQDNDSIESLSQRVHLLEHQIYPLAVQWFAEKVLQLKDEQVLLNDLPLPKTGYAYTSSSQ